MSETPSVSSMPLVREILEAHLERARDDLRRAENNLRDYRRDCERAMDRAWHAKRRIDELERALS